MIAIYPGTFDPPTNGHFDIIRRGAKLFKEVVICIPTATGAKDPIFSLAERKAMIEAGITDLSRVSVDFFDGLVAEYATRTKAKVILRGVRSVADYEYELQMAIANRDVSGGQLETLLLLPSVQLSFISSRLVREIAALGGEVDSFVPPHVATLLKKKFAAKSKQ